MQTSPLQVVILAGGTGTRLWPFSRRALPKQFQPLIGRRTLFQLAVERARRLTVSKHIFVATNEKFIPVIKRQAPEILPSNLISEPAFRDTATCLGYAATVLEARQPGGVMAVIYADHLIQDQKELVHKIRAAAELARAGKIAIIEVESQYPATELGWVETGRPLTPTLGQRVLTFKQFREKPNLATARKFHQRSNFFWNTGLYVWRTDVLLAKFTKHLPQSADHFQKIAVALCKKSFSKKTLNKLIQEHYSACEKISIDYGVMEKLNSAEVVILPARLGWSDMGTWQSLKDELSKPSENLIENSNLTIDSRGNFVKTLDKKFVALIGIDDLVVVDSRDALLICRKERSGEVKKIVQKLEEKGKLL